MRSRPTCRKEARPATQTFAPCLPCRDAEEEVIERLIVVNNIYSQTSLREARLSRVFVFVKAPIQCTHHTLNTGVIGRLKGYVIS